MIHRVRSRYQRLSMPGKVISIVLVIAILLPSFFGLFEVVNGIILYNQVRSGLNHIQALQTIFSGGPSGDYSKYFDAAKLQRAQIEINGAHNDFTTLSDELDHDGSLGLVGSLLPNQINSARALGHIAVDATLIGQKLIPTALKLSPSLVPTLRAASADKDTAHPKPYLTQAAFTALNQDLNDLMPVFQDMSNRSQGVSIDSLPLSASQHKMITSILPLLPTVYTLLAQGPGVRDAFGWLLGVDQQRTFLLEPMDSAELRSTGGFTGQFGELTFNGGHMAKLQMKNIGAYEEDHTWLPGGSGPIDPILYQKVTQQSAPSPYNAWWPVANFGVRDATVSADFPTTAKIIMQYYNGEFGTPLSGVILFTPTLIKQILHVTGPITIPVYNETITEQNLEAKLHYYQLDNNGIYREQTIEHIKDAELARKAFTQHVTQTLMSTAMHLPLAQLAPMGAQMLQAMKTKDLQVYVANQQLEDLIAKYGSTASMDTSTTHDGLYVVQENLSASKASQYVTTSIKDTVTLDQQNNATHSLTMVLDYQKKGDVYGIKTYHDYVRIYVPQNSTLATGNGFSLLGQGAVCGLPTEGYPACQQDVYNNGSLVCNSSNITIDDPTGYLSGLGDRGAHLDPIGPPPNQNSDELNRAMYGGWVTIPPDCKMTVTLSWTVPAMSQNGYSLMFQPQASVNPQVDLTVKSPTCSSDAHYTGTMNGQDTMFNLKHQGTSCSLQHH
ncbi:hypothetical protein KDI_50860 [Dictyobacter arantiisoli]|uniref:DUF4012 domain-containing protein n=1 Tax=Dictyobacter arantiisoli TaxID=2014874 RepID=A0A5A5TJK0_9CHLR|nr:hypothetical protein KDI_50860 [Dictyobacter arantiisoli]